MELNMSANMIWISTLKSEIEKSPVASNMVFGFILACLEKLLEMEFACPCESKQNVRLVVLFFIGPALLAFVLMIKIQGCESKKSWKERIGLLASSCVSSVVWILLMLFDGQYVACAFSSQSGRFVVIDNASRQKLCKADNHNASQELINTQKWYSGSQEAGMWLLLLAAVIGLCLMLNKCCKKEEQGQPNSGENRTDVTSV
ncbi:uncharacterized protein LOC111221867 [Seriola dumerili]|uniref:uncharacterized protein LOC111221867 n=1 Tax=Seriola dumerili TaxID=41447 RepID=UPI000BBE86F6|nr:uncharacterized protein LOC111221867 [Seriola dumerili]